MSLISSPAVLPLLTLALASAPARAQCTEFGPVQNYGGTIVQSCPCFAAGEEALAVFSQIPASDFPILITRIGVGWASQNGGAPDAVEDALVVYAGVPSGGALPIFSSPGPQFVDGFTTEVHLTTPVQVDSGPFTVGLRFLHDVNVQSGGVFPPSIVADLDGCQPGKNLVKRVTGSPGFYDACTQGVGGDWKIRVKYQRANCGVGTPYCFGDGTGSVLCPCDPGQSGNAGEGCANSTGRGAELGATGVASVANDRLVLRAEGVPATASCLFFQGNAQQNGGNGAQFGDGLLCVTSNVIRLGTKNAVSGVAQYGYQIGADVPVSIRGNVPAVGGVRHYQVWYRNAAAFCTASTFNLSSALTIQWAP